ncbi:hypothetical protein [Rhodococcus sp. NCIMB 12038]|uniref:hypothetical protein n=1 Tax=Rhodococcus sp. NCIMB 12038 TaxID=933800 RepID=UPI000B3D35AB|nr:hypothetical protein [Rhodococcus sp. NCIMB 12038]OUS97331.1 hypothetical protein CA951_03000 [Rhodococcus sp. NCIMB 12038]
MGEARNATRFLAAFNDIEDHFRLKLKAGNHVPFERLLDDYDRRFRLTHQLRHRLSVFAALRNAIAHGRYNEDEDPIADPRDDIVEEIASIRTALVAPRSAYSALPKREVLLFEPASPISEVLRAIRTCDYSQFPIYQNQTYQGLLTTNCIARWLANQLTELELAESEPVEKVLAFAEQQDRAVHLPRDITVPDAIERLGRSGGDSLTVAALILTHSGNPDEKPLSVIVAADLPQLHSAIGQ